jgi:ADP-heptose:LPS heptosyltransferase
MAKILVIRFSAIGDVAMSIPVVYSLATQYPQHQITVLSKPNMAALFTKLPANVSFRGIDLKGDYAGFKGLNRLFKELNAENYDYIADFHDVLRTKYLRWRFTLKGKKTAHIDKGRKGKKALTRPDNKIRKQQDTSFQRYANVLKVLGLPVDIRFSSIYGTSQADMATLEPIVGKKETDRWIGIAPFATHAGKIYPQEKMEEVVKILSQQPHTRIFLFGGGAKEVQVLSSWESKYPTATCIAGKLKMDAELTLMSNLDVMVSMDSGNMHLASLVNTPVVSIWGATHPFAGFLGWKQDEKNVVQIDMPCRPCSVFGNKPCLRKDYACLHQITPKMIVERIENILS